MKKIKFIGLCLLLATTSLYAKDMVIITDKNTVDGNVKVNVLSHPKYDYESIDLYQESLDGNSTLIGNYAKDELNDTSVPINTEYKKSVLKGVVNNPKIVNEDSEVYIKTNLAYYTDENTPIEWDYLFSGLGKATKTVWTITSYNTDKVETGKSVYTTETLPTTLGLGTHIVELEYYDLYGTKFTNKKTVTVKGKETYTVQIVLNDEVMDTDNISWGYSFNGIPKDVKWYIDNEFYEELPKKLKEGDYTIRLEVYDELDNLYSTTKNLKVNHKPSYNDLIKGSVPEGTKMTCNAPNYLGDMSIILDQDMYTHWATSWTHATFTIEFPKELDINFFEIGKVASPVCTQTMELTAYSEDGTQVGDKINLSFLGDGNTNDIGVLATPERIYSSWDNMGIKNCKKLVIYFNANRSWANLRHMAFGYTESQSNR